MLLAYTVLYCKGCRAFCIIALLTITGNYYSNLFRTDRSPVWEPNYLEIDEDTCYWPVQCCTEKVVFRVLWRYWLLPVIITSKPFRTDRIPVSGPNYLEIDYQVRHTWYVTGLYSAVINTFFLCPRYRVPGTVRFLDGWQRNTTAILPCFRRSLPYRVLWKAIKIFHTNSNNQLINFTHHSSPLVFVIGTVLLLHPVIIMPKKYGKISLKTWEFISSATASHSRDATLNVVQQNIPRFPYFILDNNWVMRWRLLTAHLSVPVLSTRWPSSQTGICTHIIHTTLCGNVNSVWGYMLWRKRSLLFHFDRYRALARSSWYDIVAEYIYKEQI